MSQSSPPPARNADGGKRPKQFLEAAGIPIIFHTLRAFEQCEAIQEIM